MPTKVSIKKIDFRVTRDKSALYFAFVSFPLFQIFQMPIVSSSGISAKNSSSRLALKISKSCFTSSLAVPCMFIGSHRVQHRHYSFAIGGSIKFTNFIRCLKELLLTYLFPMHLLSTPENIRKPFSFLMFSGKTQRVHWEPMG